MAQQRLKLVSMRDEAIQGSPFKVLTFLDEKGAPIQSWLTPNRFSTLNLDLSLLDPIDDLPMLEVVTDAEIGRKATISSIKQL